MYFYHLHFIIFFYIYFIETKQRFKIEWLNLKKIKRLNLENGIDDTQHERTTLKNIKGMFFFEIERLNFKLIES